MLPPPPAPPGRAVLLGMTLPLPAPGVLLAFLFVGFGASAFCRAGSEIKTRTWPRARVPAGSQGQEAGGRGRATPGRRAERERSPDTEIAPHRTAPLLRAAGTAGQEESRRSAQAAAP